MFNTETIIISEWFILRTRANDWNSQNNNEPNHKTIKSPSPREQQPQFRVDNTPIITTLVPNEPTAASKRYKIVPAIKADTTHRAGSLGE